MLRISHGTAKGALDVEDALAAMLRSAPLMAPCVQTNIVVFKKNDSLIFFSYTSANACLKYAKKRNEHKGTLKVSTTSNMKHASGSRKSLS